jgi:hypothetical protein
VAVNTWKKDRAQRPAAGPGPDGRRECLANPEPYRCRRPRPPGPRPSLLGSGTRAAQSSTAPRATGSSTSAATPAPQRTARRANGRLAAGRTQASGVPSRPLAGHAPGDARPPQRRVIGSRSMVYPPLAAGLPRARQASRERCRIRTTNLVRCRPTRRNTVRCPAGRLALLFSADRGFSACRRPLTFASPRLFFVGKSLRGPGGIVTILSHCQMRFRGRLLSRGGRPCRKAGAAPVPLRPDRARGRAGNDRPAAQAVSGSGRHPCPPRPLTRTARRAQAQLCQEVPR